MRYRICETFRKGTQSAVHCHVFTSMYEGRLIWQREMSQVTGYCIGCLFRDNNEVFYDIFPILETMVSQSSLSNEDVITGSL